MGLYIFFAVLLGILTVVMYHYWHDPGHGPNVLAWLSCGTIIGTFFAISHEVGVFPGTMLLVQVAGQLWVMDRARLSKLTEQEREPLQNTPKVAPLMIDNPDGAYFLVLDGEYSLFDDDYIDALAASGKGGWVADLRGEYMVWEGDKRIFNSESFWREGKTYIPIMRGGEE
jgi:hypothetical protein